MQFRTLPPENFQISEWISCYNEVSLPGITFETNFGLPSTPIHYISGENEAMIYPLIMQNQIENLFFVTNETDPIIINREDGLSRVDLQNPALSINILEIFNLSSNDLADNNLSMISSKLNGRFEVSTETNTLKITEQTTNVPPRIDDNPDAPVSKVYNPCGDYEFIGLGYAQLINSLIGETVFKISEDGLKVYWNEKTDPDVPVDMTLFQEAALACVNNNSNYCICPNIECFMKHFAPLIDGDEFPKAKEKISKLAVITQLHLTDDEQTCLDNADGLYEELADILGNNSLTSACEPSLTPEEMMNNAIDNMTECSLDGFYQALGEEEDYIIKQHLDKCPQMECVLDKMLNIGICNQIKNSFNELEGDFDLIYWYDYNGHSHKFSNQNNYGPEYSFSGNKNDYVSTIGKKNCTSGTGCDPYTIQIYNKHFCTNLDPLEMAKYMIHETMHSEFHRWVYEFSLEEEIPLYDKNFITGSPFWNKLVTKKFGSNSPTNQHALMNQYVEAMSKVLWELNGKQGTAEQYKYFIYDLLTPDDGDLVSLGFLSQSELDNYLALSSTITSNIDCP